ncbi:MAG: GTPase HflX [bacterium]|nr:GTPase HflX [bacterium]
MTGRLHQTARIRERGILVGADQPGSPIPVRESLAELGRLAATAGLATVGEIVQVVKRPSPATFIGAGKVEEVKALVAAQDANVVLFDDPLAPAQQRNLEKAIGVKIVDRSALILDIFAMRARSTEGKLQVELAQLQYLMPRLTRAWTHLSRQAGGGVGTRGPGETQLEVDRRRVRERIAHLRRRLEDVERTRNVQREERGALPTPTVALVGYTNAGKSTLMNALTKAGVLVEDKLFATLDPTVRRLRLPDGQTVLLADTVGFIHKLPHQLVEAFKSTLEQVRSADLLVHVVDASHPGWAEQRVVTERVLGEIGAGEVPVVFAFNKCDVQGLGAPPTGAPPDAVCLSARAGEGLPALLRSIEERVSSGLARVRRTMPADRGDLLALLRRTGRILEEYYRDGEVTVTALVPPRVAGQLDHALRVGRG